MPLSAPRDRVVAAVIRTLAPYVGQNLAGSAVRMQLEKLALRDAHLDEAQLDRLLAELAPALHVFIGKPKTLDVLEGIRESLRMERRGTGP